jgi:hypothetical protein
MKTLFAAGLLALAAVPTAAHATWAHTAPSTPATSPDPSIMVHPPIQIGQQWVDTYFRSSPGGLTPAVIYNARCVVVYYHGGGFTGGDPRGIADAADVGPDLIVSFVKNLGCIFIAASYPLNDPGTQQYNIQTLYGSPSVTGSVAHTFGLLYNQYIQYWMSSNPAIRLYTAGGSAGTVLAQRLATSGNWPIQETFLIEPPVGNPKYKDPSAVSPLVGDTVPPNNSCAGRFPSTTCGYYRFLFGEFNGGANPADLSYYTNKAPNLVTNVIMNACDETAELGSAMKGYFNHIPNLKLSVHKGYTKAELNQIHQVPSHPTYLGGQHGAAKPMLQEWLSGKPNPSRWAANGAMGLPAINGSYKGYCSTGNSSDDAHFRAYLNN